MVLCVIALSPIQTTREAADAESGFNKPAPQKNADLGFNSLHGDCLIQLAALSGLKRLNLSSNCISSVPPEEHLRG